MLEDQLQYKRLGGWLLAFVIMEIYNISSMSGSIVSVLQVCYQVFLFKNIWILAALVFIVMSGLINFTLSVILIYMLIKRKPVFKILFLIRSVISSILLAILVYLIHKFPWSNHYIGAVITFIFTASIVFGIAITIAWFVYFSKSIRVKIYMEGPISYPPFPGVPGFGTPDQGNPGASMPGAPPFQGYPPPWNHPQSDTFQHPKNHPPENQQQTNSIPPVYPPQNIPPADSYMNPPDTPANQDD